MANQLLTVSPRFNAAHSAIETEASGALPLRTVSRLALEARDGIDAIPVGVFDDIGTPIALPLVRALPGGDGTDPGRITPNTRDPLRRDPDGTLHITEAEAGGGGGGGVIGLAVAGGVAIIGGLISLIEGPRRPSPPPANPPRPAPSGPTPQQRLDRLIALPGTRVYPSIGAAGAGAGQEAYQRTRTSAGSGAEKWEYGAFIFQYQGKTFTAPVTDGESHANGQARVPPTAMLKKLLEHIGQVGIRPADIVIVGMVHSHPTLPGFQAPLDPDIDTYNTLKEWTTWDNKGGIPINFQRSYIWGPRSRELGERDPVGELYTYPPQ